LDQLLGTTKEETKELALIVKGDVQGSCEGLINGLEKIKSEKVSIRVIHQGVGNISENDVLLAVASKAMVLGFKVKPEGKALDVAQKEEVEIRLYDIIYEAIQDVAKAMLGLVSPDILESYLGRALVRQIFQIPKIGKIAGCLIEDGKITRKAKVRVFRRGNKLFEGKMETLKRFQDDVSEVKQGFECGICVANFQDFEEGDIIEAFELKEVEATELT
jgi:translation initiation factor IF-2